MEKVDYLILGKGFTARSLIRWIEQHEPGARVVVTSRKGAPSLEFDLDRPDTWQALPAATHTLWTFPAAPLNQVKSFYESKGDSLGRLVVIGSTSAFQIEAEDAWVNEQSPLDLSIERVQGEDYLRSQGARVVFSSGIYGYDRDPLEWVKSGRVGKSQKYVNMIHVDDLAQVLIKAALVGGSGQVYIASNSHPQTWQDIIDQWEDRNLVKDVPFQDSKRPSKRVDASSTLKALNVRLKFQNFANSIS